ncbi:hypothetical protein OsJ_06361 [Oryza sativa Japonica Group]|uniref:Uncharacterized protein n=1 Tax=Oryza sativa subsp. japonica TaxID=39947 RepID=B9F551_ORYSJ|nr:hypothetical protein OsJ_06361 [Oryza sativa Japonica Group]
MAVACVKGGGGGDREEEAAAEAAPEVLLLEHFPAGGTSPSAEGTGNDQGGTVVGKGEGEEEDGEDGYGEVERARALAAAAEAAVAAAEAAARVVRMSALRRASREERAAVRIQAFYRGYLCLSSSVTATNRVLRVEPCARSAGWCGCRRWCAVTRCGARSTSPCAACRRSSAPRPASAPAASSPTTSTPASPRSASRPFLPPPPPPPTAPGDGKADTRGILSATIRTRLKLGERDESDDDVDGDGGKVGEHARQQQQRQRGNDVRSRSPFRSWDGSSRTPEEDRAEGVRRHDAAARRERARAYAYGYQQRQWQEKAGGFQWLDRWMAAQAQQHAPEPDKSRRRAALTAAADGTTMPERTVEMDTTSYRSPLNSHSAAVQGRPPAVPGYMAATQAARARARTAPPATPAHARSRSGAVLAGDTSSSGQSGSGSGGGGAHVQKPCAVYSPESRGTGDWTPPRLAVSSRATRLVYA